MTAAVPGARLRRTWPQRLLIGFNVFLIVACLAAAGGLGWFYWRFGQLPRIALPGLDPEPEDPGDPQNFLLVGSDTRAFVEGGQDAESFGDQGLVGGERADTIIVVRVDPRSSTGAMLSFPRDLRVEIAGTGRRTRINEAFSGGGAAGAERLIATIQNNFGIPIHHFAQIDFAGFRGLVNAVGGVELYFASPVRDRVTGLDIQTTGCVELSGDQALAFVRSRHFQYLEDGRWRTDPRGDIGRIERQQDFIQRAIREALSKDLLNPRKMIDLVDVAIDNVTIDDNLSARDIVRLGRRFRTLAPDRVQMYTLPVDNISIGGASMLGLRTAEAQPIFDVFRGIDPNSQPVQPSSIRVRVLNGTGVGGQAGQATEALSLLGFNTTSPGDDVRTERTTIRFGPGQGRKAQLVARYLVGPATLVADPTLEGLDLVLTTGADYDGVLEVPKPPEQAPAIPPDEAATTTTTAPPAGSEQTVPEPQC